MYINMFNERHYNKQSSPSKMIAVSFTVVFSLLVVNSMVLADLPDEEACAVIFNGTIIENDCCESMILLDDDSKSSQCGDSSEEGDPCDNFKCILEESGYLEDGKFSEEKAKEVLNQWEKDVPDEKATVDRIRRECLDGKYLKYTDDDCEPLKFFTCLYINSIIECQSWKKDELCGTMKEYVQQCKKSLQTK